MNRYRAALCELTRWLVRERRIKFDPLVVVDPLNVAEDRRRVRRALSGDELARLLEATKARPLAAATAPRAIRGKPNVVPRLKATERARLLELGEERALLYAFAAGTGLRRGELSRLRWCDLAGGRVDVPAASAKSRKDQWVPLREDLAAALAARKARLAALHEAKGKRLDPSEAVFSAEDFPKPRTFERDLLAAGLAKLVKEEDGREWVDTRDDRGRVADFHSLRVSFVSGLAAKGVHPRVAQALARHSSIELTMKVYTDVALLDLKGAVELLAPKAEEGREERRLG